MGKNIKIPPTITVSIFYYNKLAGQSTSGLGEFLECHKYNILVITQALVLCLIYMYSPLGTAHPQALYVYIRQSTLACVITYTYMIMDNVKV